MINKLVVWWNYIVVNNIDIGIVIMIVLYGGINFVVLL